MYKSQQIFFTIFLFIYLISLCKSIEIINSEQYYPIETDATCSPLNKNNNLCANYLNYNRIYTSSTQQSQDDSIIIANNLIDRVRQFGNPECSQFIVLKSICTYLFPECLTYKEEDGSKEFNVAIRTCYDECYQSVEWCSYEYEFNCSQNLNGYSVPLFPQNSTKYNFEDYGYSIIDIPCADPFNSDSSTTPNYDSSSIQPTPLPEKTHHSSFFKFIVSFAIIFPIVLIIGLVVYNINNRKLTKKKLNHVSYEEDDYISTPNGLNNNIINPNTGNSIVNEYTPLINH